MTNTSKVEYAINLTESDILFQGGYITLPKGGHIQVTPEDKAHPHFAQAATRGMIKFSKEKPSETALPAGITFEESVSEDNLDGSMSEEELKTMLQGSSAQPDTEGTKDTPEAAPEPESEAEEKTEDAKPKASKKSKIVAPAPTPEAPAEGTDLGNWS